MQKKHKSAFRVPTVKLLVLLIHVLNYELKFKETALYYREDFGKDLLFCPKCFEFQIEHCEKFFKRLRSDEQDFVHNALNIALQTNSKRSTYLLRLKDSNARIISKNFAKDKKYLGPLSKDLTVRKLSRLFRNKRRAGGLQFCPMDAFDAYVKYLQLFYYVYDELLIRLYLLQNSQLLHMTYLNYMNFPVPKTHAVCGFTLFQEYAGRPLIDYYDNDNFLLKVVIGLRLMEAAITFTAGVDDIRFYITDMNSDNVVYNEDLDKIFFVDLDTMFIVITDTNGTDTFWNPETRKRDPLVLVRELLLMNDTHKHNYLDCDNCFAYSPQEICNHTISDVNIYAACSFLRENLSRDQTQGFLYPVPVYVRSEFPSLGKLLNECVDCPEPSCKNRFESAQGLLKLFNYIIEKENAK